MDAFLSGLTFFLQEEGCPLIGHIKGVIEVKEGGQVYFSITSFGEKIRYRGSLVGKTQNASLTINVIVYGVKREIIEKCVHESLKTHFDTFKLQEK
jgi:hypothetical protein